MCPSHVPDDDAISLSPGSLPRLLPSLPLLASGEESNLVLQRYKHPPSTIDVPGLRDHLLVVHLAGPVFIEEKHPGGRRESRWSENGQVSLTPATQPVSRVLKGKSDVLLIHIAPRLIDDVIQEVYDLDPTSVSLLPRLAVFDQALNQLGRLLMTEIETQPPGTGLMADSLGRALALNLLRHHSTLAPSNPERRFPITGGRLRRVIEHMRTHLDTTLSLAQLAGLGGLSQSQFARAFREATGQPPHRYLISLRIDRARDLLEHTRLSVIEVGMQCGFEQPNHFATMFRKLTGMSPRDWRLARRS